MTPRPGRLVLLGHPVAHSLSPTLQNAALRSAGIPLTYEALDVPPDALDGTLAALLRERAAGNVTVPHKAAVAARCARLTPLARAVGAVNTFWTEDGLLSGDNTDVAGFHAAAAALLGTQPCGQRVAVLGAGGGAAAVLAAVERWRESEARVYARRSAPAQALAARFSRATPVRDLGEALAGASLVVNATPVGLRQGELPTPVADLPPGAAVLDLVYRRGETDWVRRARAGGHAAADGLRMLVEQGALAFERWFGVPPSREAMWAAIG